MRETSKKIFIGWRVLRVRGLRIRLRENHGRAGLCFRRQGSTRSGIPDRDRCGPWHEIDAAGPGFLRGCGDVQLSVAANLYLGSLPNDGDSFTIKFGKEAQVSRVEIEYQ